MTTLMQCDVEGCRFPAVESLRNVAVWVFGDDGNEDEAMYDVDLCDLCWKDMEGAIQRVLAGGPR